MALTHTNVRPKNEPRYEDPIKTGFVDITFDSSYPTGGEAIDVTDIDSNLTTLLSLVDVGNVTAASIAYRAAFDLVNVKVAMYGAGETDAGDEVTATTDLSGVTKRFMYSAI